MKRSISLLLAAIILFTCMSKTIIGAAESSEERYYIKTTTFDAGLDEGYAPRKPIKKDNPHYGWDIGRFYLTGFRSYTVIDGVPVFYKYIEQSMYLHFQIEKDIERLDTKGLLSISDIYFGYDADFGIPYGSFKRGALFVQRTAHHTGEKDKVREFYDFLGAMSNGFNTSFLQIDYNGIYDVALDYTIEESKRKDSHDKQYWDFKVPFRFKVVDIDKSGNYVYRDRSKEDQDKPELHDSVQDQTLLQISSPLFAQMHVVNMEAGSEVPYTQVLKSTNSEEYVVLSIIPNIGEEKDEYPNIGKEPFDRYIKKALNGENYTARYKDDLVGPYQARRISYNFYSQKEIAGEAAAIWLEDYVIISILLSPKTLEVNERISAERWISNLSIRQKEIQDNTPGLQMTDDNKSVTVCELLTDNNTTVNRVILTEDTFSFLSPEARHSLTTQIISSQIDRIRGIYNSDHVSLDKNNDADNGPDAAVNESDTADNGTDVVVSELEIADSEPDIEIADINGNIALIQSKYYRSGQASIDACFESNGNGKYKYYYADGRPMAIEVPKDQYDDAVQAMRAKIKAGLVNGVTDPGEATKIVRKGIVTYKQAVHIAKAGTIESLTYDAVHSCVTAASSFGVSTLIEFAINIWNEEPIDVALNHALLTGLQIGGTEWIVSVVSSQLMKTGINSMLIPSSRAVINAMGPDMAAFIANTFGNYGTKIYGAAAKSAAAKILRGGTITTIISISITTIPDIIDAFQGRISARQLTKNVVVSATGVAGGIAGYAAGGAAIGSIFPGAGTVVGGIVGIIGSILVGSLASFGASAIADLIAPEDSEEMIAIIQTIYQQIAEEYLLNQSEGEIVTEQLERLIDDNKLKDMFASKDREVFAREMIEPLVVKVTNNREKILLPNEEETIETMKTIIQELESAYEMETN